MSKAKLSQSQQIVSLVTSNEVFMCENVAYIVLSKSKGRIHAVPISSSSFIEWLHAKAFKTTKNFPQRKDLEGVQQLLKYEARKSGVSKQIHSRFASVDKDYYLDLGRPELEVVQISNGRWKIVTNHSLVFNQEPSMRPLPVPIRGSNPLELFDYINVHDQRQKLLILAWAVSVLAYDIQHPILLLQGSPASGKTTAGEFLRLILDPSDPLHTTMPSQEDQLALIFSKNPMVFIDNCSAMSQSISDMYCKAVTGDTYSKRQLYTDHGVVYYKSGLSG